MNNAQRDIRRKKRILEHAARIGNVRKTCHSCNTTRVTAKQGFRAFHAARRTIQGYEAMHMIRKGQARWVSGSDGRRQIQFINKLFGVVA